MGKENYMEEAFSSSIAALLNMRSSNNSSDKQQRKPRTLDKEIKKKIKTNEEEIYNQGHLYSTGAMSAIAREGKKYTSDKSWDCET